MSESIVAEPDIFVDNAEEDNFDNIVPSVSVSSTANPAPKKKKRRPPPALIPIEEVAEVCCSEFDGSIAFRSLLKLNCRFSRRSRKGGSLCS